MLRRIFFWRGPKVPKILVSKKYFFQVKMDKDKTVLYATVQGRAEGGEGEALKDLKGGGGQWESAE